MAALCSERHSWLVTRSSQIYDFMDLKDFEIMAPVGSRESLAAAIQAGADSIYFGIENLNMRARSANTFTIEDLR